MYRYNNDMINDEGNDDADNNSTPASSELPRYRGPVKLVWEDGQQIMRTRFRGGSTRNTWCLAILFCTQNHR